MANKASRIPCSSGSFRAVCPTCGRADGLYETHGYYDCYNCDPAGDASAADVRPFIPSAGVGDLAPAAARG